MSAERRHRVRALAGLAALALVLLTGGCDRMDCVDTYPVWKKMLVGLPLPLLAVTGNALLASAVLTKWFTNERGLSWAGIVTAVFGTLSTALAVMFDTGLWVIFVWLALYVGAAISMVPARERWDLSTRSLGVMVPVGFVFVFMFVAVGLVATSGVVIMVNTAGQVCTPELGR